MYLVTGSESCDRGTHKHHCYAIITLVKLRYCERGNASIHSTKYGMYQPNCGLNNVMMSFGHDEYLYQVLVRNGATLPPAALSIIRFHSFYPWHTAKAYSHLCSEEDLNMLPWVLEFK